MSGTVEEIELAISEGRDAMVYFSDGPIIRRGLDIEQLKLLEAFRKSLGSQGLLGSYKSLPDLKRQLDDHIARLGYEFANRISTNFDRPRNLTDSEHQILLHFTQLAAGHPEAVHPAIAVVRLRNEIILAPLLKQGASLDPSDQSAYVQKHDFITTLIHQGFLVESQLKAPFLTQTVYGMDESLFLAYGLAPPE
jgi:hypothetical protein